MAKAKRMDPFEEQSMIAKVEKEDLMATSKLTLIVSGRGGIHGKGLGEREFKALR